MKIGSFDGWLNVKLIDLKIAGTILLFLIPIASIIAFIGMKRDWSSDKLEMVILTVGILISISVMAYYYFTAT